MHPANSLRYGQGPRGGTARHREASRQPLEGRRDRRSLDRRPAFGSAQNDSTRLSSRRGRHRGCRIQRRQRSNASMVAESSEPPVRRAGVGRTCSPCYRRTGDSGGQRPSLTALLRNVPVLRALSSPNRASVAGDRSSPPSATRWRITDHDVNGLARNFCAPPFSWGEVDLSGARVGILWTPVGHRRAVAQRDENDAVKRPGSLG